MIALASSQRHTSAGATKFREEPFLHWNGQRIDFGVTLIRISYAGGSKRSCHITWSHIPALRDGGKSDVTIAENVLGSRIEISTLTDVDFRRAALFFDTFIGAQLMCDDSVPSSRRCLLYCFHSQYHLSGTQSWFCYSLGLQYYLSCIITFAAHCFTFYCRWQWGSVLMHGIFTAHHISYTAVVNFPRIWLTVLTKILAPTILIAL